MGGPRTGHYGYIWDLSRHWRREGLPQGWGTVAQPAIIINSIMFQWKSKEHFLTIYSVNLSDSSKAEAPIIVCSLDCKSQGIVSMHQAQTWGLAVLHPTQLQRQGQRQLYISFALPWFWSCWALLQHLDAKQNSQSCCLLLLTANGSTQFFLAMPSTELRAVLPKCTHPTHLLLQETPQVASQAGFEASVYSESSMQQRW